MLINTAMFGQVEVAPENIFHMPEGMLGFEELRTFALITRQEDGVTLRWFQSAESPVPCFVVFDPFEWVDGYAPALEKVDLATLKCSNQDDLSFLTIAVIPDDLAKTTINLKSPIVLNHKNNTAKQVILSNNSYPIKFALVQEGFDVAAR